MSGSDLFSRLRTILNEKGKTAADSANAEPTGNGATGSDSSSPTVGMDGGLVNVTTGERDSQMKQEIKENVGAASSDAAPDANKNEKAEERQADVGLTATGVGRDPKQEDNFTGSYKEPGVGTSTPAKFTGGEKYSGLSTEEFRKLSREDQAKHLEKLGSEILSETTREVLAPQTPGKTAGDAPASGIPVDKAAADAAAAGFAFAEALGNGFSKEAGAALVETAIADALFDADLVGPLIQKLGAEEPEGESTPPSEPGSEGGESKDKTPAGDSSTGGGEGGGDAPPVSSAPPAPPAESIPPISGPAPGGGMPPGGGGGEPPMPSPEGLADAGASLGMTPPPGPGAGAVGQDEAVQQLLMAAQEMGMSPQDLIALITSQGAPGDGQKAASAINPFLASGKFEVRRPKNAREEMILNTFKRNIGELQSRSSARK